ncbi:MAG: hypothetical protein HY558_00940 [Euryarchaeota archaeon]|nr:hypothetical protein [Euryarchaeota archaeon]
MFCRPLLLLALAGALLCAGAAARPNSIPGILEDYGHANGSRLFSNLTFLDAFTPGDVFGPGSTSMDVGLGAGFDLFTGGTGLFNLGMGGGPGLGSLSLTGGLTGLGTGGSASGLSSLAEIAAVFRIFRLFPA